MVRWWEPGIYAAVGFSLPISPEHPMRRYLPLLLLAAAAMFLARRRETPAPDGGGRSGPLPKVFGQGGGTPPAGVPSSGTATDILRGVYDQGAELAKRYGVA